MNSSDIIAIIAIVISAIVAIVSSILAYRSNKDNIQARRSEIAFGKRLEAFQTITKALFTFRISIVNHLMEYSEGHTLSKAESKETIEMLNENIKIFTELVKNNLFYLPNNISSELEEFMNETFIENLGEAYENRDYESLNSLQGVCRDSQEKITKLMQEFIGL